MILYITNIIALVLNNTFGSYLAVMLGIVFGLIISYKKTKSMFYGIVLGAIIFVLTSICMDTLTHNVSNNFKITTKDTNKILDTSKKADDAGSGRWLLWKGALKYSFEKPVLGYGPENLQVRYLKDNICFERPHNEYLQYAAYFGYPGLLFYLTGLVSLFIYYCIKRKSNSEITTTCLMVVFGYCVSAFFGLTMFYTVSFFYMFLGLISKRTNSDKDS